MQEHSDFIQNKRYKLSVPAWLYNFLLDDVTIIEITLLQAVAFYRSNNGFPLN